MSNAQANEDLKYSIFSPNYFCLFTWKSYREEELERHLPSPGSFPKHMQRPGLCQAEVSIQESHPGLPHGGQDPSTWTMFYCIWRDTNGELIGIGASSTQASAHMECQHHRHHQPHHNVDTFYKYQRLPCTYICINISNFDVILIGISCFIWMKKQIVTL